MDWQLIESDDALQQLLDRASGCPVVAVDTEFMRRNTFYPQVALLQLCFGGGGAGDTAWLVDPLALQDPSPLAALLSAPDVEKVLHSASEDLEVFQRWLGVLPQPLFDTQRAAALLDRGFGVGYRALVQAICGIDLPKGETRSDWLQRPLSHSQCDYAAQDVLWLLPVYRELNAQCVEQGKREWVLADGRDAVTSLASAAEDYHLRIKNAWKLSRRQLGILAAVAAWREETARRRDKPRSWIIDDQACLQLALRDPRSWTELQRLELPRPALRHHGEELLALLAAQRERPDDEMPQALPAPLDAAGRQALKQLKAAARETAERLGIAPEVLLQSRDYEILLREAVGEAVSEPRHWSGWREEVVIDPLRRKLQGGAL
jgi:ribonuclease D